MWKINRISVVDLQCASYFWGKHRVDKSENQSQLIEPEIHPMERLRNSKQQQIRLNTTEFSEYEFRLNSRKLRNIGEYQRVHRKK
jgi:hypothetical protein